MNENPLAKLMNITLKMTYEALKIKKPSFPCDHCKKQEVEHKVYTDSPFEDDRVIDLCPQCFKEYGKG